MAEENKRDRADRKMIFMERARTKNSHLSSRESMELSIHERLKDLREAHTIFSHNSVLLLTLMENKSIIINGN